MRVGVGRRGPSHAERLRFAATATAEATASVAWPALAAYANRHWYAGLLKPFFAPGPWLALSLLAGVAALAGLALFRILCRPDYHPDRLPAIRTVLTSWALAAAWVWAFFVGRHPSLSLALAVTLVGFSVLGLVRTARVASRAALLLAPWTLATLLVALVDLSVRLRNG